MMIGIMDYNKQKNERDSYSSGNSLCYSGYDGRKYPEEEVEGDGFKQGDIVEVEVNIPACTVKYLVNGILKATQSNNILSDNSRLFMPYVEMGNTNDMVEWVVE